MTSAPVVSAQTDTTGNTEATAAANTEANAAANTAADTTDGDADQLTQTELENLVAPIALYPDTLLIQVLVAATYPLQIIKANRFLAANADMDADTLQTAIEGEGYDASVAVLATAFPDVLSDMGEHVEWTETIGTAMLAQSDDVMTAVQTMRQQAINSGALISGEAQTVEVQNDEVVIQPTNPDIVYVPQYDPQVVYVDNNNSDILMTGLVTFGTFALINAIFDNNNHWNNYWGCRNCAGWGGGPIIRNPNVNIGIDGNVNIGNKVNVGNGNRRAEDGWKPKPGQQKEAREKIANKRGPDGKTKLPVNKNRPDNRGDSMRANLAKTTGAADIARTPGKLPQIDRGARPGTRPAGGKNAAAIAGTHPSGKKAATNRAAGAKKPAAHKPVHKPAAKPANRKPAARAPARHKSSAMARSAPSHRSHAASSRGRSSGGGHRGRR